MIKAVERTNMDSCLNRALEQEMIFVLLARDESAPAAIRAWIEDRVRRRKNEPDDEQIKEARRCAEIMEVQHRVARCVRVSDETLEALRKYADWLERELSISNNTAAEMLLLACGWIKTPRGKWARLDIATEVDAEVAFAAVKFALGNHPQMTRNGVRYAVEPKPEPVE